MAALNKSQTPLTKIVLYTKVDAQSDKLRTLAG